MTHTYGVLLKTIEDTPERAANGLPPRVYYSFDDVAAHTDIDSAINEARSLNGLSQRFAHKPSKFTVFGIVKIDPDLFKVEIVLDRAALIDRFNELDSIEEEEAAEEMIYGSYQDQVTSYYNSTR